MNENILIILLVVIIFALFVSIAMSIVIFYKLNDHFNDMDYQYTLIRTNLNRLVAFKDDEIRKQVDRYISTRNGLDAIIGSLDDICKSISNKLDAIIANQNDIENEINEDSSLISRWYAKVYEGIIDVKANNTANSVKARDILSEILEDSDDSRKSLDKIVESIQYLPAVTTERERKKKIEDDARIDREVPCDHCKNRSFASATWPCVCCCHKYVDHFEEGESTASLEDLLIDGECEYCKYGLESANGEHCKYCSHSYITKFEKRGEE